MDATIFFLDYVPWHPGAPALYRASGMTLRTESSEARLAAPGKLGESYRLPGTRAEATSWSKAGAGHRGSRSLPAGAFPSQREL